MITWGSPWRGKIEGGQISLPTGATKTAPQPSGRPGRFARHYDEHGYTYLQRGPNASASRSTEELAEDIAAGRTWRTDAILSGSRMQLYGRLLDGWVYCAPDGTRWRVPTAALDQDIDTTAPLNVSMALTAFGGFAGVAAEQVVSASLASLGQAEPDPDFPAGSVAHTMVCDITPDGSRALVMIYLPVVPFSSSTGFHPLHKRPLGWLELELAGGADGVTASLSVVRTRAQAFGSGVRSSISYATVTKFEQADALARVDMGTYFKDTYTPVALGPTGATGHVWQQGGGSYELSFAGRILALWYLPGGLLEECTLDLVINVTESNPAPDEVISGSRVEHVPKEGGEVVVISDDRQHRVTRTCTATEACAITLKRGGVVVEQINNSAEATTDTTRWFIRTPPGDLRQASRSDSVTLAGTTLTSGSSTSGPPISLPLGLLSASWLVSAYPGNSPAQAAFRSTDMQLIAPGRILTIDPLRYSNNLLALRRTDLVLSVGEEVFQAGPAATPGGASGALATTSFGALFGAYNPATGEVSRDKTAPVCWV